MSVAGIKNAVAGLPERDRAELAAWLLDSLPAPAFGDENDDGHQEAARRREELDSGHVTPLPAEEFWSDVDRARSQWK
jgi:putative addiction module component (TIGR02574 family)